MNTVLHKQQKMNAFMHLPVKCGDGGGDFKNGSGWLNAVYNL